MYCDKKQHFDRLVAIEGPLSRSMCFKQYWINRYYQDESQ